MADLNFKENIRFWISPYLKVIKETIAPIIVQLNLLTNTVNLLSAPKVAGYRASTTTNINASASGVNVVWDDLTDRRQDVGINIDPLNNHTITVSGNPDHIEINVCLKFKIADTQNAQRPNQVVDLVRSDDKVIGSSATGYIRDASDHEESSHSISVIDYSPIENGTYTVISRREGSNGGAVNIETEKSQITFRVFG